MDILQQMYALALQSAIDKANTKLAKEIEDDLAKVGITATVTFETEINEIDIAKFEDAVEKSKLKNEVVTSATLGDLKFSLDNDDANK